MSPFQALYGTAPPFHNIPSIDSPMATVEDVLLERKIMNVYLRNQLAATWNKMKQWADKH